MCETIVDSNDVYDHTCMEGYEDALIENGYFYPICGKIHKEIMFLLSNHYF